MRKAIILFGSTRKSCVVLVDVRDLEYLGKVQLENTTVQFEHSGVACLLQGFYLPDYLLL